MIEHAKLTHSYRFHNLTHSHNLADPRRMDEYGRPIKEVQSRAHTVEERVIIDKHVVIYSFKNNALTFVQKVGRIC